MAKVAQFDVEGWRQRLEQAGITVQSNAEAMTLLNRVFNANQKLREKGLPVLRINTDLLEQLRQAEDRLRAPMEANTKAIEDRAAAMRKAEEELNRSRDRAIETLLDFVQRDLESVEKLVDNRARQENKILRILAEHPDLAELDL